jgi:RNA polymerase sigma factor (TIGR02999 family)
MTAGSVADNPVCFDEILPVIYEQLRRLAALLLRKERPGHLFGPTDLIAELYLRLRNAAPLVLTDREHLFAVVSRNMQQILVDEARRRGAARRGAGEATLELDETQIAVEPPAETVALDNALDELARREARLAQIFVLYHRGGLTYDEIATVCNIHSNTVSRDLRTGEAWLRNHLCARVDRARDR